MRALIVETGHRVGPFEDAPDLSQLGASTIRQAVSNALLRRGFTIERVPVEAPIPKMDTPTLVLADHCFVSDKCLGDFLAGAFGQEAPARLALCKTPSSDYTRPVSSVAIEPLDDRDRGHLNRRAGKFDLQAVERLAYDCFFVPDGGKISSEAMRSGIGLLDYLRDDARRHLVAKREIVRDIRMPLVGDPSQSILRYPITSTVAAHVEHWVHILWLNHIAFGFGWGELIRRNKLWTLSRLLRAIPPTFPNLMRQMVYRGKGVRIHPSALVEGSILGDGVVIGARASVRNSILGNGVEVGDHATVLASSVGARTYVTPKTFFVWSTAYEDAVISNYKLQMSVVGRSASSSTWAGLIDAKFQGSIDVMHRGQRHSTERSFLGSAIGHNSYIGAKVLILPGRSVPNQSFIAMRPDELIRELPAELTPGTPYVRDQGTLVPLSTLLPPARNETKVPASDSTP